MTVNNNISGGGSSRYCLFSTCLPPTLLHLWRSCALKLVHPLCWDAVSESFQMSIDSSLTGSLPSWLWAQCPQMASPSTLFSQITLWYSQKLRAQSGQFVGVPVWGLMTVPTHRASRALGCVWWIGNARYKAIIGKVSWDLSWLKQNSL